METTFKVIVAGGRDFNDYKLLTAKCDNYLINKNNVEIVSGAAKGADSLAIKYANERGYALKIFTPDWSTFGKRAGYLRNEEMGNYADALIAFWDGESRGTKHMIDIATDKGLLLRIIRYNKIFNF
jgi:hypothetical protein